MWTIRGTWPKRLSKRRPRHEAESMLEGGLFHVEQSPFFRGTQCYTRCTKVEWGWVWRGLLEAVCFQRLPVADIYGVLCLAAANGERQGSGVRDQAPGRADSLRELQTQRQWPIDEFVLSHPFAVRPTPPPRAVHRSVGLPEVSYPFAKDAKGWAPGVQGSLSGYEGATSLH
jgi:hypothetical protein